MGIARNVCFAIGYMHLIACVLDIGFHLLIAALVSQGFQCDVSRETLHAIDWPFLDPWLLIANLGTHGFHPFPPLLTHDTYYSRKPLNPCPRCYPAMLHIDPVDLLIVLFNAQWLKFVVDFVTALHKKNLQPLCVYYYLCLVKLCCQVVSIQNQPIFYITSLPDRVYDCMKVVDVGLTLVVLIVVQYCIKEVDQEMAEVLLKKQVQKQEEPLNDVAIVSEQMNQPDITSTTDSRLSHDVPKVSEQMNQPDITSTADSRLSHDVPKVSEKIDEPDITPAD